MEDWTRVSCTSLSASYMGEVEELPRPGDGLSSVGWYESSWPHDPNAIGVTLTQFFREINEADMRLNGVHFTWITGPGVGNRVNAYSILLHEGGHYYGLGHSSDPSAAMYFAYEGGVVGLSEDDRNGICALYPLSTEDCRRTGCPSGFECVEGRCVRQSGSGEVCAPCESSRECAMGLCLLYPDGRGYCGRSCRSDADCGSDRCVPIEGAPSQCVRIQGRRPSCAPMGGCTSDAQCPPGQRCDRREGRCVPAPPSGRPLGEPCTSRDECLSRICFAGRCSQSCDWLDPRSCPAGFYCNGLATGSCGTGLCLPGQAGSAGLGQPCERHTECETLFCAESRCSLPCIPGGASSCPEGLRCQAGLEAGCGSCQPAKPLGESCETSEDCASRLCALQGDRSFCTAFCDAEAPCPDGFRCQPIDAMSAVCVADRRSLGEPCTSDAQCASGRCISFASGPRCAQVCDEFHPCPDGYRCTPVEDASLSVCELAPPPPSHRANGCTRCASAPRPMGSLGLSGLIAIALALFWLQWNRRGR
ncbi:MAG: matrixin family metalloprotease [Sandaracinaceae bacterium]|nr:matrixin family metalloprotease [Sandaracinaceae bacterium]